MAAWAGLHSMQTFTVTGMTGTLPHELATAWPNLAYLDLAYNGFAGVMPAQMNANTTWCEMCFIKAQTRLVSCS